MEIGYFTPPQFENYPFNLKELDDTCGKRFQYASKGRWCLYHILKSFNVKGPILVPVYCCNTVLEPFNKLGIEYHFYDICEEDCNADIESIKKMIEKYKPDSILAVSMYGNPCKLSELENICKEAGIYLIDDAAQSWGAVYKGRKVGSFGDAGFFSLSPGKPNAGHMGGFFWTDAPYSISYTRNFILHKLIYWDFYFNRLHCLQYKNNALAKFLKRISSYVQRRSNIIDDGPSDFEEPIIGGIMHDSSLAHTPLRTELAHELNKNLIPTDLLRQILPIHSEDSIGIAHKYILVCRTKEVANLLINFLRSVSISCQLGYKLLTDNLDDCPKAKLVDGRVVEIPLDPNKEACTFITNKLNLFIEQYRYDTVSR